MQKGALSGEKCGATKSLSFREFRHTDTERCVEITDKAWPELERPMSIATVEWYLSSSTCTEVACIDDKMVGLLFGKIDRDLSSLGRMRIRLAHANVYLRVLFGLYGRVPDRMSVIRCATTDDRNIAANTPSVDGEVVFFAVDADYRKQGIGRALMDRFVHRARKAGARKISVCTSDPGSDWGFYERYGFTKHSSFKDNLMSRARKEEVKALIYLLDIDKSRSKPEL